MRPLRGVNPPSPIVALKMFGPPQLGPLLRHFLVLLEKKGVLSPQDFLDDTYFYAEDNSLFCVAIVFELHQNYYISAYFTKRQIIFLNSKIAHFQSWLLCETICNFFHCLHTKLCDFCITSTNYRQQNFRFHDTTNQSTFFR